MHPNDKLNRALADLRVRGTPTYMVAAAAGVAPSLLSMIARGQRRPSAATAMSIAEVLGRRPHELFADVCPAPEVGAQPVSHTQ